jgi:hypothetical protein
MLKIQYFPHDVGARNDPKLVRLRYELGLDAVAIYWSLVEMLYENQVGFLKIDYKYLSKILHYSAKKIQKIIENYSLFVVNFSEKKFYSERANETIKTMQEKHSNCSEGGKKGMKARWGNKKSANDTIDDLYETDKVVNKVVNKEVIAFKTLNFKDTTPSVVCDAHAQESAVAYSKDFLLWFEKYGHSPYFDSLPNSFEEWEKLDATEQTRCLSVVDGYVALRPVSGQRHNPVNYLKQKIFSIAALHSCCDIVDSGATSSRSEKRIRESYGAEMEQEKIRNKTEEWSI